MRRNLSQVGNPGWASMGDGMRPERPLHTHAPPLSLLENLRVILLPDSSSYFRMEKSNRF